LSDDLKLALSLTADVAKHLVRQHYRLDRLERALRALLAEVANQPTHAAEVATQILNEE